MSAADHAGPIVVGIDGSPHSLAALEWAAEEAVLKKVDLHVVTVWHMPHMFGAPIPLPDDFDPVRPAVAVLSDAQEPVIRDADHTPARRTWLMTDDGPVVWPDARKIRSPAQPVSGGEPCRAIPMTE